MSQDRDLNHPGTMRSERIEFFSARKKTSRDGTPTYQIKWVSLGWKHDTTAFQDYSGKTVRKIWGMIHIRVSTV